MGKMRKIIAICFYCPPRSKAKTKLVDLLSTEISRLRTQYSGCGIILCGDRNDLKLEQIQSVDPALRQVVTFCTNKNQDKTLDIVMTDLSMGYQEPTKIEAIKIDEGKEGVPSDHWGVDMKPRSNCTTSKAKVKRESFRVQPITFWQF